MMRDLHNVIDKQGKTIASKPAKRIQAPWFDVDNDQQLVLVMSKHFQAKKMCNKKTILSYQAKQNMLVRPHFRCRRNHTSPSDIIVAGMGLSALASFPRP